MTLKEQALKSFEDGYCCSQAVFSTYARHWGFEDDAFLKIPDAFGGGIGGTAGICGVVTGAVLTIGLKYGRTQPDDAEAKQKTRTLVKEFINQFKAKNNSIECKQLLGIDISTPEGMKSVDEKGLFQTICPKLIDNAMDILSQLIPEK